MGELVNQGDLGTPREYGVEIHLFQDRAAIRDPLARDELETGEQLLGAGAAIGLDVGHCDIFAALLSLPTLFEHGECLASPGSRTQVDLETPTPRCHKAMLGRVSRSVSLPRSRGRVREGGLGGVAVFERHCAR